MIRWRGRSECARWHGAARRALAQADFAPIGARPSRPHTRAAGRLVPVLRVVWRARRLAVAQVSQPCVEGGPVKPPTHVLGEFLDHVLHDAAGGREAAAVVAERAPHRGEVGACSWARAGPRGVARASCCSGRTRAPGRPRRARGSGLLLRTRHAGRDGRRLLPGASCCAWPSTGQQASATEDVLACRFSGLPICLENADA